MKRIGLAMGGLVAGALTPALGWASEVATYPWQGPTVAGIPVDFILFALVLLGVALFHNNTLQVALTGLTTIIVYKLVFTGFKFGPGLAGLALHMQHEWVTLANLFCLLMGFALLADHFEKSHVPDLLPRILPEGWQGAFVLLVMIAILSSFLDNIAAALIGGAVAFTVFRHKVHIGYIAAIVAASNAGGAGSVVGDTTTTMMWIAGVNPVDVLHAYAASLVAVVVSGIPAALQQHKYSPLAPCPEEGMQFDRARVGIVFLILVLAIVTNVTINVRYNDISDSFPFIGVAVWVALLVTIPVRKPNWELMPETLKGTIFLLSLVTCASMMPVEKLPPASWESAFTLGFVSAVFDNIPLTALAIKQNGYDWGMLAYAVGYGGSMIWFGSSAGVAISNFFPQAKSVGLWLRHGWHVTLAYIVGFAVMMATVGWQPHPIVKGAPAEPPAAAHK